MFVASDNISRNWLSSSVICMSEMVALISTLVLSMTHIRMLLRFACTPLRERSSAKAMLVLRSIGWRIKWCRGRSMREWLRFAMVLDSKLSISLGDLNE